MSEPKFGYSNQCTKCKLVFRGPLPLCPKCQRPFCTKDMVNHTCLMLNYKMAILVRKDLHMTPGKVAAQVAHAASELTKNQVNFYEERMTDTFEAWEAEGARIVVLGVDNLEDLLVFYNIADRTGLHVCKYADGGITEVHPGEVTVLGIGPDKTEPIDSITGGLEPY